MATRIKVGTTRWLRGLFRFLNKEFFEGKLPKIPVEWGDVPGTHVARVLWAKPKKKNGIPVQPILLQMSEKLRPRYLQKQVGMSMLHEMAHLKCGFDVDCQDWDGEFDKVMFDLAKRGAFRYFW